ncbi:MAG: riboflavin synthase subunit alpha [Planctomycetes bacterium RBG_13_46_10]|nr:MAG: riboflavin synthase subunit alpha [Planctomycetes bacterium RBG_13_46_10]
MFTGLIEAICTVKSNRQTNSGALLTVDLGELDGDCKIGSTGSLQVGDSIAINGVCLTIAYLAPQFIAGFDISTETLAKTTLGKIKTGSPVNVERALKATDRFGGHFVQGHIDGTAIIKAIKRASQFADIEFSAEPELLEQMIVKSSVSVDGISLTIASMNDHSFSVALIPETLKRTTLGTAKVGDVVNIETDIIVKTVKKHIDKIMPQKQPLTVERLKQLGF